MKKKILALFLFTVCLILCACVQDQSPVQNDPAPPAANQTQQQTSPPADDTPAPPANTEDAPQVFAPEELTVELVVEWEAADAILSRLEDMGEMLRLALKESGYSVERVTLTISTAHNLHIGSIQSSIKPIINSLLAFFALLCLSLNSRVGGSHRRGLGKNVLHALDAAVCFDSIRKLNRNTI